MILAAASIQNPDYVPTNYQTFLLTVFVMLIHACISSMPTLWIARFNSYGSTFNMIGLVVVVIMIPASVTGTATTPKFLPSSQVWSIQNGTEWPDGVAVLMSFIAIIWTMSGYGMLPPPLSTSRAPRIDKNRCALPSLRRMLQRKRCLPTSHRHDSRYWWSYGLGSPTRRCVHSHRYPIRHRLRSRPAMGFIPRASHASKNRSRYPFPYHHLRLFYGTGLHDCCVPCNFRICS
jgi:hypothetical protein